MDTLFFRNPKLDAGLKNEVAGYMDAGGREDLLNGSYGRELAERNPFRPAASDTAVYNEIETDRLSVLQRVREIVSIPVRSTMTTTTHSKSEQLQTSRTAANETDTKHACSIDGSCDQRSKIWLLEKRNVILEVALILLAILIVFCMFR